MLFRSASRLGRLRPLLLLLGLLPAALASAQQVTGWGINDDGETNTPAGLVAIQISAGGYHNVALKPDGTVAAWGYNGSGECNVPAGLSGVIQVAAGDGYTEALKSDGTVVAWGDPYHGETNVPAGLSGVIQISAGEAHSLAVKSDGTVVSWGDNHYGQTDVPAGLTGVVQVAAGFQHSLALKSDGTVVSWGDNPSGLTSVPAGLSGVVQVAAGYDHSLALKSDGTVVAWGYNNYGQASVPAGLSGVTQVSASNYHSLATKSDGTVVAWGQDNYGQSDVPAGLTGVARISAGYFHSLSLAAVGVAIDRISLYTGESATGTITFVDAPGAGGATLALSSDDPSVHLPSTVFVPQGAHSATFPVTTDLDFHGDRTANLYAIRSGKTYAGSFTLKGETAALSLSQTSIVGGSTSKPALTVSLGWAPLTDVTLSFASSDPSVTLPATVTIPAGQTSARFFPHMARVASTTSVTLIASYGGSIVASTSLTLRPLTATLNFAMPSVVSKHATSGVLQLNAAVADALDVPLASGDPNLVDVPSSVRVVAGAKIGIFPVSVGAVSKSTYVAVTGTVNGKAVTSRLQILPPPTLSVLTVPTYGFGHQVITGTVTLRAAAPDDGATIDLSASGAASVPATVTVAPGQTTANFPITLDDVSAETPATITASAGGVAISKPTSARPLAVSSLALSASTVVGGTSATATVTLNAAVGVDTVVTLSSDNPAVASVPSTVTIQAGNQSATFTITTTHPTASKNVKITASKNGTSAYRTLKVTP